MVLTHLRCLVCVWTDVHMGTNTYGTQSLMTDVLNFPPLCLPRQGLSLSLGPGDSASQPASGSPLFLPPRCWGYWWPPSSGFLCGHWDPNSGPWLSQQVLIHGSTVPALPFWNLKRWVKHKKQRLIDACGHASYLQTDIKIFKLWSNTLYWKLHIHGPLRQFYGWILA